MSKPPSGPYEFLDHILAHQNPFMPRDICTICGEALGGTEGCWSCDKHRPEGTP